MPSSLLQISSMGFVFAGVMVNADEADCARETNSCTASDCESIAGTSSDAEVAVTARLREGTRQVDSPEIPSASRLVAMMRRLRVPRRRASATRAQAET